MRKYARYDQDDGDDELFYGIDDRVICVDDASRCGSIYHHDYPIWCAPAAPTKPTYGQTQARYRTQK